MALPGVDGVQLTLVKLCGLFREPGQSVLISVQQGLKKKKTRSPNLRTPAPMLFYFILFSAWPLSFLHLCLGILGHKSTNGKSELVTGNQSTV